MMTLLYIREFFSICVATAVQSVAFQVFEADKGGNLRSCLFVLPQGSLLAFEEIAIVLAVRRSWIGGH